MKKIKFMLVAMLAVFGLSTAFADELVGSTQYTGDGFQYKIKALNVASKTGTVIVSQSNWVSKAADKSTINIPATIKIAVKGEVGPTPIDAEVTFDIVEIAAEGFKGLEDVTAINFAEGCKINTIGAAAFEGTKIANLDLTNTKVTTLEKLFEDANTTLKTVKFPATLTSVKDYALQHCYALNIIDAQLSTSLVTLGVNCFGDNVVEKLDLSKTKIQALNNTPFVGKAGESGEKNKTLKELVLPNTVLTLGKGLANLYNLEKVNLQDTKITDVDALAFENDKSLAKLTFPATLKNIVNNEVFKGCASLAELTFDYAVLERVGSGTGYLFTEASLGDGSLAALKTLVFTTKTPATTPFKAEIRTLAFSNCTGITSVKIAEGGNINSANLAANAIALSNEANSTVVMGKLSSAPAVAFIAGPTAAEVAANVTVGEIAAAQAQTAGIVSGNIGTFTVGKISAAFAIDAIGQAQTIVFAGDITTALTAATVANARLTTINFGSIKIADAADIIPVAAFNLSTLLSAVTWTPVIDDANPAPTAKIFNQNAFGTASVNAAAKVIFTTVPEVAALYPGNVSEPSILDPDLWNVKFVFAAVDKFEAIKVYGPDDAVVYVGYFNAPAGSNYYIEKSQGDAVITVYSAFVDASDNKIYMDPLMIVNGKFVVEGGQTVVVRSTTGDDVKAYTTAEVSTMRYAPSGTVPFNELKFTDVAISADELGTKYYDKGQYVYYLQNPKTATGINFQILGPTQYLFKNAVYVVKAGKSAARLEVVWLDDQNSTTAIQAIEKKVNAANDAIYNLSGQRVDASYKGVVIKNGKKYIQK